MWINESSKRSRTLPSRCVELIVAGERRTWFHCDRMETACPRAKRAVMVSFSGRGRPVSIVLFTGTADTIAR
jgi:hypothetical protein